MYVSNAACPAASSTSPVVERKTTAAYVLRREAVNAAGSSVASTSNPAVAPRDRTAATPSAMDACRKPVVREYTRIRGRSFAGGVAGSPHAVPASRTAAATSTRPATTGRVLPMSGSADDAVQQPLDLVRVDRDRRVHELGEERPDHRAVRRQR